MLERPAALVAHDAADQVPARRIDAARIGPAPGQEVAAFCGARAAAWKDEGRANEIVGRGAPHFVLRRFGPHAEHPVMAREIGQHPAGRAAALRHDGAQFDERAIGQFAAADAARLQHAKKAALMEILDRLVGDAAQLLGLAGAPAQHRDQGFGARPQGREIGRGFSHDRGHRSCRDQSPACHGLSMRLGGWRGRRLSFMLGPKQ